MEALIDKNGRVCELVETKFPVHPDLTWIEAPDGVTTRYTYKNGLFSPPPAPDPLKVWESEMAALDQQLMADARYWEELASGKVTSAAGDRMASLINQREILRTTRP